MIFQVRNIVDKAVKELGMEKTLNELNKTWSATDVEYITHARTGTPLVRVSEELIETLEDNQVSIFWFLLLLWSRCNVKVSVHVHVG